MTYHIFNLCGILYFFFEKSDVVIWDVPSTNESPSLLITCLVGVLIMKLLNFSVTDQSMTSRIAVQMLGALSLPCPTPRMLYNKVVL